MNTESLTVFAGTKAIATGDREAAVSRVRALLADGDIRPLLVFDDRTGAQVDLDLREGEAGSAPVASGERREPRGPGRPRLGVIGREVTLMPRHWEWLSAQPGGASVALRKLVERAIRDSAGADRVRHSQEATLRFMTAMAGNEPGYEEACRALFRRDAERFDLEIAGWPRDVSTYARTLAADAFGGGNCATGD